MLVGQLMPAKLWPKSRSRVTIGSRPGVVEGALVHRCSEAKLVRDRLYTDPFSSEAAAVQPQVETDS
jgi:hypothetical protein